MKNGVARIFAALLFALGMLAGCGDGASGDDADAGAGVGPGSPDAPYYRAVDQQALGAAFQQIIGGVPSCVLELEGSVVPGMEAQCAVEVGGESVPYDDPDGWQLNSPSEMELVGDACESIQDGMKNIRVACPCDAVAPR
ncbi:MAG: hypothetical protein GY854_16305 [Deltaproteobacteria bacterium]|nr:hypothetical protein [Deltaproteobacteria bacterium]